MTQALVLFGAGCGQTSVPAGSPPATPVSTVTTTTPSSTTVPVGVLAMGPGRASLSGTVQGPTGPVSGATVDVERLVAGRAVKAMLTSGPGGTWQLPGVLGGGFSIRAWLAPGLAQTTPSTFFLVDGATHFVTLKLADLSLPVVQSSVAPDPPLTGVASQVVIQVDTRQVHADGSLTNMLEPGLPVQLTSDGGWLISLPQSAITDAQGQASWIATCTAAGTQSLSVDFAGASPSPASATSTPTTTPATAGTIVPLNVADCVVPPPVTTTSTTTTTTTSATTTTTSLPTPTTVSLGG